MAGPVRPGDRVRATARRVARSGDSLGAVHPG
jgi:acyl dehydratase